MRLAVVFELLLILLIIAFAASNVIRDPSTLNRARLLKKVEKNAKRTKQDTGAANSPTKYCNCSSAMCNCCRDFNIPVVSSKGPGCATISFLKDNEFGISMKYGDRILRNITIRGEKPQPVCMRLPGGVSKFCGRVYNIEKQGEQFKACLGLELRALENLEAALRVSCFRFGPEGLKVEAAEPFPPVVKQKGDQKEEEEEDDDDEYADDDDDDDDDDFGLSDDDDDDDDSEDAADNDVDSTDYTGFSALSSEFLEGFFGSDSSNKKKKKPLVKEKPYSHSSMHTIMTHKQESMQSHPVVQSQTMSQRPNKVKPTRVAPVANPPSPVATVAKVPAVKPTAAPVRNKVKVKVPVTSTTSTTTERVTPSSIEPVVFVETTTSQPIVETTEKIREEDGNMEMVTSTMVSITSMQQLEEEEEDEEEEEEENEKGGGGGGGGLSTTTEMGTTEHTTETYTEREVTMSDRVDELKMETNDKELLVSAAKIKDEDDEEEEEDDDDDDDDVASVVDVTTLLDDDEDADQFGTNVDGKQPNKKKEEDLLSGILDDDDDDDEEEEEENAKKDQRTISLVEPPSPVVRQEVVTTVKEEEQPTTMLQPSTTTEEVKMTRPPLAGMRLFVLDPKHPSKTKVDYARSSRAHRRMRLPPLGMESQFS